MNAGLKKVIWGVVALALVVYAGSQIWKASAPEPIPANTRIFKDVETGKEYPIATADITQIPMVNPDTGERTLYPTEICYAGQCADRGGTRVILNQVLGKKGPTYCPVCGTLVRPHNPDARRRGG